jgi:hypothetical protein
MNTNSELSPREADLLGLIAKKPIPSHLCNLSSKIKLLRCGYAAVRRELTNLGYSRHGGMRVLKDNRQLPFLVITQEGLKWIEANTPVTSSEQKPQDEQPPEANVIPNIGKL